MERTRQFRTTVYELVVGFAGVVVILLYIPQLHSHNWLLAVMLGMFATVLESIPVPLGKAHGSLMIALPIGVMVLYGSSEAVCLSGVAMAFAPFLQRRKMARSTWVFNVGQYSISMCAMVEVYRAIHSGMTYSLMDWKTVLGVLCGVAAHIVVNHALMNLWYVCRGSFTWSDIPQLLVTDGLNTVVSLPLAFLLILTGKSHAFLGPFIVLPIALLGYLIRLYRVTAVMQRVHLTMSRLMSEFDVKRLCQVAAVTAAELSYADAVVTFVYDEDKDALMPMWFYPESVAVHFSHEGYREADGGIIWSVIRERNWVYVPNISKDSRVKSDGYGEGVYKSMVIFPMVSRGSVQGALVCYSQHTHAFGELIKYLQALADQMSVLIDNAKLYQKLHDQSSRDGATGLFNYRYFYEELAKRVQYARERETPVSVAVVDVDYFKKFNDTYGHLAGDAVLRSVGHLLVSLAGPEAVVARYGGEEFGIVFPYTAEHTFETLEKMRIEVSRHVVDFEGYRLQGITISSGIASFPKDASNDRDLLLKADSAMYWGAKQRGRNRTALYSPEFDAQLFVDELTGLYTYHFINIKIREELAAGVRNWGAICLDLENFSYVNTAFGFEVGDNVLKETSLLIKESLRQNELACRFGGDEFLILLPNMSSPELTVVADRVANAVANHRFGGGAGVILSLRTAVETGYFVDVEDATDLFDRVSSIFTSMQTSLKGESLA